MPCFLNEWDSRNKEEHWTRMNWPTRQKLIPGQKNVQFNALVLREKILLPPLHIKIGLIKQFVKALNKDSKCFKYVCQSFPQLSEAKLKEGIFVGPK